MTYKRFIEECQLLSQTRSVGFHVRMGQFFCNKFPWLDKAEPQLFYMESDSKASEIIKKYIVG